LVTSRPRLATTMSRATVHRCATVYRTATFPSTPWQLLFRTCGQDASLNSPVNRFLACSLLTKGITKCAVRRRSLPRVSASWSRSTIRAGPINLKQAQTGMVPRRPLRCGRRVPGGGVRPVQDRAAVDAVLHESLKGAWHLAEFVWKKHFNFKTSRVGRRMNL